MDHQMSRPEMCNMWREKNYSPQTTSSSSKQHYDHHHRQKEQQGTSLSEPELPLTINLPFSATTTPVTCLHSMHSTKQPFRNTCRNGSGSVLVWVCVLSAVLAISSAAAIMAHPYRDLLEDNNLSDTVVKTEEEQKDTDDYLERYGYYRRHQKGLNPRPTIDTASLLSQQQVVHTNTEREDAIRRLQSFYHIRPSGHIDDETKSVLTARRCGLKDVTEEDDDEGDNEGKDIADEGQEDVETKRPVGVRSKRWAVNKYKDGTVSRWEVDKLTWKITKPSSDLPLSEQRRAVRESFAVWAPIVPIRFEEERGSEEPDIRLEFVRGRHGPEHDPVFDGADRKNRQNTLAHAWGPSRDPKGFPGDVHYDEADDWSNVEELKVVTVHELGHSLGLLHSKVEDAIMFPIYRDTATLSQDDRDGINYLYGPGSDQRSKKFTKKPTKKEEGVRKWATVKPEWVTTPRPLAVDSCPDVTVDAVFQDPASQSEGMYLAISGGRVHTLSSKGRIIKSRSLEDAFPELPENPQVALSDLNKEIVYFFKENMTWAYKEGVLLKDYPRSIQGMGFPENPQYSITVEYSDGESSPYLIGKQHWWMFDAYSRRAYHIDSISDFSRDMPKDVTFAVQWSDNRVYAVTKNSYVILDKRWRATHTNPIAGKPDWLKDLCPTRVKAESSLLVIVALSVTGVVICALAILLLKTGTVKLPIKQFKDIMNRGSKNAKPAQNQTNRPPGGPPPRPLIKPPVRRPPPRPVHI